MAGADDAIRASDAERDAVVETLHRHTADGRLTMAEFEERVAEALAARTRGDLAGVLRELPPLPPQRATPPTPSGRVRRRRPALPRRLPQVAFGAVIAAVAALLIVQGAWWVVFPLFWLVGGARHGGACGRRRTGRHVAGWDHRHDEPSEHIRV